VPSTSPSNASPLTNEFNSGQLVLESRIPLRGQRNRLAGPRGRGDPYWAHAWIAALVLFALVVSRYAEMLGPVSRARPVVVATLVLGVLLVVKSRPLAWRLAISEKQIRFLIFYAAWAAITIPFALWQGAAFQVLITLPTAILLTLSILLVAPTLLNLERITLGIVAIVSTYGAFVLSFGLTVGAGRLTGTGTLDPNDLAGLMAMILPMAMWLIFRRGWWRRLLGVAAAGIMLSVIVQTASRGGLVGLAVGVVVLLLALNPSRVLLGALAITVAAILMWRFGPPVFRERATSMFTLEEDYNVTDETGRVATWKRGIQYALQNPITGVGLNNFGVAEGLSHARRGTTGAWRTAHNTYIQAFAELGLVGGFLLLAMLGRAAAQGSRMYRRPRRRQHLWRPDILASLAAFAASAVFLSHAYSYALFGILAISTFVARVNRVYAHQVRARALQPMGRRGSHTSPLHSAYLPATD